MFNLSLRISVPLFVLAILTGLDGVYNYVYKVDFTSQKKIEKNPDKYTWKYIYQIDN